jgi:hypothetical protein
MALVTKRKVGQTMASSPRRQSGGKKVVAASGKRKRAGGTEKTTGALTAIRLVIAVWELIRAVVRDDHWLGSGPGRLI